MAIQSKMLNGLNITEKIKPPADQGSIINQLKCVLICNLISLNVGLVSGWVSPTIAQILAPESPIPNVTTDETAWLAALLPLGAFFGTYLSTIICEKFGRKFSIIFWAIPFMVNSILIVIATDISFLLIGRFLAGCGIAGCMSNVSAYVGETAIPRIRGTMSSLYSVICTSGITLAFAIGGFLNYIATAYVMLVVGVANIVLCMLFIPETPVMLVKNGQMDKAASTLAWLRGLDVKDPEIQTELENLKTTVNERPKSTLKATKLLVINKALRRGFLWCIVLLMMQCLTGMFTVHSYALSIFMESGASDLTPAGATTLYGCIQILGTMSATKFIDKWGRKILMSVSLFGVSFGMFSLATYFYLSKIGVDLTYFQWVPVVSLCFCVYIYSAGAVGVPIAYITDVLTNDVRNVGTMYIMQTIFIETFIILRVFAPLTEYFGFHVIFYSFGIFSTLGGIFVLIKLPETKGKSIEEVLEIMGK